MTFYKQGSDPVLVHQVIDEERVGPGDLHEKQENTADNSNATVDPGVIKSENPDGCEIFLWKNIHYEVPVSGGHTRKLLDDISGYVAPGKLTALMGETGAGKVAIRAVGGTGTHRGHVSNRPFYCIYLPNMPRSVSSSVTV